MLAACHGRIEHQCETLRRLVAHLPPHGADGQARDAARAVMRYFDGAAVHHHQDEEHDLFPALLASMAGSDAVCLRELTAALGAEHRALEEHWRVLHRGLSYVADGDATAFDGADVEALVGVYERHIARENAELLPLAQRLLDDASLAHVGRAMRARRGLAD